MYDSIVLTLKPHLRYCMEFVAFLSVCVSVSYLVFWLYFQAIFSIFTFIRWLQEFLLLFFFFPLYYRGYILEWNAWYLHHFSMPAFPEIYFTSFGSFVCLCPNSSIYSGLHRWKTRTYLHLPATEWWQFLTVPQHACNISQYSKDYLDFKWL